MTRDKIDEAREELRQILREQISSEAMRLKLQNLARSIGAGTYAGTHASPIEADSPQLVANILGTLRDNTTSAMKRNIRSLLWPIKINCALWTAVLLGTKVFTHSEIGIKILIISGILFSLCVYWQYNKVWKERKE